MRLSEPIEQSGYFWLPGNPDKRLPGVLRISSSEGAILEVIGIFGGEVDGLVGMLNGDQNLDRIVGVLENGDLVTLDNCFYKHRNIRFGGLSKSIIPKSIIHAQFVFRGANYDEGEAVTFSRLSFSVEGLDEWLSISGFQQEVDLTTGSVSVHFDRPNDITIQLPDEFELRFGFGFSLPGGSLFESRITQKAGISLISKCLRPLKDFSQLVFKINNFLCFATDRTVSLDSVVGYSPELTQSLNDGETMEVPIKIYYRSSIYSDFKADVSRYNMLFSYRDLGNELERVLVNWLANYEVSRPAFNLYFSSRLDYDTSLNSRFLSLIQGIETLHRRNSSETCMSEDDFNRLVQDLLDACPDSKRKWLGDKLSFANELSLRMRVKQMLEPFKDLYGDGKSRKSFVDKAVDTRNYFTHYDKRLESRAALKGEELLGLCEKLEALFQLHLLRIVGFDDDSVSRIANENHLLRQKLEVRS